MDSATPKTSILTPHTIEFVILNFDDVTKRVDLEDFWVIWMSLLEENNT